ncbi:ketoacyl-ACP synthase III [Phragmitibacter flavus]|uniref:Beta-ketoacyl-[acyl-carrier-protein] synthase III n=1 Tax=Phragmitibacter flavus TaxID=2576071 RepID=A0A5R8KBF5_9BACT|nr:beta-ketoacyl-ACP synthase III [Phragmitibacter flavus]TLD69644.1 ketoacyl-ACP synthase III [Phragmitibacter flavus]
MSNPCACSILGTGSYMPEHIMTNADLEKLVETSDEWITSRTGIRERRIAAESEMTSDMSATASLRAMEMAGVTAEEIDLIIVATVTPDMVFPATACLVQRKIGAINAVGFDISAACSGFLFALQTARHYLNDGTRKTALIIGAEKLSPLINWKDRNTCVLFGDGAGAAIIRSEDNADAPGRVLSSIMASDGNHSNLLKVITPADPAQPNIIHMEGRETFKHAVTCMLDAANKALAEAGLTTADIDLVVPHQANLRIINAVAERLGLPPEKAFVNVDKYGNTSAATIPVALDEANRQGRMKKGDIILLVAFGGGFTWASTVIRW